MYLFYLQKSLLMLLERLQLHKRYTILVSEFVFMEDKAFTLLVLIFGLCISESGCFARNLMSGGSCNHPRLLLHFQWLDFWLPLEVGSLLIMLEGLLLLLFEIF